MTAAPFLALAALAMALVGAIAWELRPSSEPPAPAPLAMPGASPAAPTAERGAIHPAETLLSRPLFNPSRRPSAEAASVAEAAPDPVLPRLAGIMVTPAGRTALFARQPHAEVLREGDRIGGYTVLSIKPGQVTLSSPEGLRDLRPSFSPSRPPVAAAAAQPFGAAPPVAGAAPQSVTEIAASSPLLQSGASAVPSDLPQDAMPFDQNPTPSGLAILRNQASRSGQANQRQ